jgi:peroxiredoxin/uncharacterized membrane protein YphA (DoxX/SURF4 family)
MEIVLLISRLTLAAIFGTAGIAKLLDRPGTEKALASFGTPAGLVHIAAYALPLVEIGVAIALLATRSSWIAAGAAVALLAMFTAAMAYQMHRGNNPDCHCFGQIQTEPISGKSLIRNAVMAVPGIILLASGANSQGVDLLVSNESVMQLVLGIAVVGLLVAVVIILKRISEQQVQIMRRIEVMELAGAAGGEVERSEVTHPHEGLPIGAVFPDFELYDTSANKISLATIRASGTPTLFLFVSPTCAPCKALLPEFREWRKELMGRVNFVFMSTGKAADNIEKFGGDPLMPVLLQEKREVADALSAKWTPTAVLMDGNGRVASHAAAGDTAIRKLIAQLKEEDLDDEFVHFASGDGHGHTHSVNKIGDTVPDFRMQDIKGRVIDSDYFRGKQTLVAFWSLTCPFCIGMIGDLKEWYETKSAEEPELVVFSEGDPKAHEEFGLKSPVILDEGYKTAAAFGMFGTPSAVLVNEQGRIVSETAVGAANIWSLVGRTAAK